MTSKKWLAVILVLGLLLTLSVGCGRKPQQPVPETPAAEEDKDSGAEAEKEKEKETVEKEEAAPVGIYPGNLAIPFKLKNHRDETVVLSQFRGKPVVITFWVTWSREAMDQIDTLNQLKQQFEKDVAFIGIHSSAFDVLSYQETVSLLRGRNDAIEMLIDEGSAVNSAYYIGNYPTTFFIDSEGRVVKSVTTVISKESMIEEINELRR
jgi:peroxiredoxin